MAPVFTTDLGHHWITACSASGRPFADADQAVFLTGLPPRGYPWRMIGSAQDRRSHGRPLGGAGRLAPHRRGHRRGADRSGLRRLAAVRRPRRRPGPAPGAHRRRVPGAARPLRRGRLHPGAAGAAGHPLHRLGRAGLGAGHEQGQGEGGVPPATTCRPRPATWSRPTAARTCSSCTAPFGFPVVVKPCGEGSSLGIARRARRAGAGGRGRGRAALRRRRAGRAVRRGQGDLRRPSSTASRSAPSRSCPSAASTTSTTSTPAAAPSTTCPRACRPSATARCCGWPRSRTRRSAAKARRASTWSSATAATRSSSR